MLKKWPRRLFWAAAILILLFILSGIITVAGLYWYLSRKLPEVSQLERVQLQQPLRIYSRDQKLIAEYGEKRRFPLSIDAIPPIVQKAFLAAEDDRFTEHPGVDYQGLMRATLNHLLTGDKSQGGSTITMQVARNFFLSPEKSYIRKLNEILLALKIEREFSKDKILELYLNKIYLGKRAYGVAAAARVYYGKTVDELTLAQVAMIAGLPKAPSAFNPIANPERALQRRNYVLARMLELKMISDAEYSTAVAAPNTAATYDVPTEVEADYLAEMVRAKMVEIYGEDVYTSGLRVYTTLDSRLQEAANRALRKGLLDYTERHGYTGPIERWPAAQNYNKIIIIPENNESTARPDTSESTLLINAKAVTEKLASIGTAGNLQAGLVIALEKTTEPDTQQEIEYAVVYLAGEQTVTINFADMAWASAYITVNQTGPKPQKLADILRAGDIIWLKTTTENAAMLAQLPKAEAALASLDAQTGAILALVGGFDFFKSKFNRAIQARRQAGSSFKPFLYSAALEHGLTAATIINDAPVVFDDPSLEAKWRPENYTGRFYGPTRLREGLVKSRNLVSIRVLIETGISYTRRYAERFGFTAEQLPRDLSLALGSGVVSPLEMVTAFTTFANTGYRVAPYFIDRIDNTDDQTIWLATEYHACLACKLATIDPIELDKNYKLILPAADSPEYADIIKALPLEPIQSILTEENSPAGLPDKTNPPKRKLHQAKRVIEVRNAYIMNSMLQEVIQRGTAVRARSLGRSDLAGKTGTTNDQNDAWFNGYNPNIVASVWVGFDSHEPLGARETGARAALPIWMEYMRVALKGVAEKSLPQPDGLVTTRIDADTGLLATSDSKNTLFELFLEENVPTRYAEPGNSYQPYTEPSGKPATESENDSLF